MTNDGEWVDGKWVKDPGHIEPYGGTGVDPRRAPESHKIAILFESLAAEDKLLTKHNLRRDQIVDELIALGATF